jgi:hypothetical protein
MKMKQHKFTDILELFGFHLEEILENKLVRFSKNNINVFLFWNINTKLLNYISDSLDTGDLDAFINAYNPFNEIGDRESTLLKSINTKEINTDAISSSEAKSLLFRISMEYEKSIDRLENKEWHNNTLYIDAFELTPKFLLFNEGDLSNAVTCINNELNYSTTLFGCSAFNADSFNSSDNLLYFFNPNCLLKYIEIKPNSSFPVLVTSPNCKDFYNYWNSLFDTNIEYTFVLSENYEERYSFLSFLCYWITQNNPDVMFHCEKSQIGVNVFMTQSTNKKSIYKIKTANSFASDYIRFAESFNIPSSNTALHPSKEFISEQLSTVSVYSFSLETCPYKYLVQELNQFVSEDKQINVICIDELV